MCGQEEDLGLGTRKGKTIAWFCNLKHETAHFCLHFVLLRQHAKRSNRQESVCGLLNDFIIEVKYCMGVLSTQSMESTGSPCITGCGHIHIYINAV